MKMAHLSDLHFGRRISRAKQDALGTDLVSLRPDLIIISGDITDQGFVSQFRRARDFLQSLAIPFISVPGNREICATAIWEWLFPPLAMRRYGSFFGDKDRILFRSDAERVVFFGLNSVHPLPSWPGKIARESRYWLREQAARFPGYFKGLFLHHPVLPVIRSSSFWAHSLSEAGEMLNICTQTGISLILQGHKHRSSVAEIIFPERDAKVVVSACGAPLMPHWDSTYHLVEISEHFLIIQPREFLQGGFAGSSDYRFNLNKNRTDRDRDSQ